MIHTQPSFTCSKSTTETPVQCVKSVQIKANHWHRSGVFSVSFKQDFSGVYNLHFSGVSNLDFKQAKTGWAVIFCQVHKKIYLSAVSQDLFQNFGSVFM